MTYRLFLLGSAAVAASIALSACSGTPSNDQATNSTALDTTPSASAPAAAAITPTGFDPAQITPTKFGTGKAITDGFGITCPFNADAQDRPDVAGVGLAMSLKDAVSVLACRYPDGQFGVNANDNPYPYAARNSATYALKVKLEFRPDRPKEAVEVVLGGLRGEERVIGVWRTIYYSGTSDVAPLTSNIVADLTKKYGAFPSSKGGGPINAGLMVKTAAGQILTPPSPQFTACVGAINFNLLSYSGSESLIDGAANAGCGDLIAFGIGNNAGVGLTGDFTSFVFNPTYAKTQYALSQAQRESDDAAKTEALQKEAGQRQGPTL